MKKTMKLLSAIVTLLIVALCLVPLAAIAETDAVIAQNDTANLVNALIVALIPVVASLLANLTEKKDTDNPWKRLSKNALNMLALNFSSKAGK